MTYLSHLLDDTVTIASESGRSNYGDPSFGAQREIKARVEVVDQVIVGVNNNQYRATSYFVTEDEVLYTDRIWLPGANVSEVNESSRALKINYAGFPDGSAGHYEVWL